MLCGYTAVVYCRSVVVAALAVWKLSQYLCESVTIPLQYICTESEVCTRMGHELYELLLTETSDMLR